MVGEEIRQYTAEEFLHSEAPYRFAYQFEDDKFTQEQILAELSAQAQALKIRNFKKMFTAFRQLQRKESRALVADRVTEFEGQELELDAGEWICDERGIRREGPFGDELACVHPILPIQRLTNVDTGHEKLQIAFRKGRQWRKIIADRETLATASKIVSLANTGISVNSENSRLMVRYLHDIENKNFDLIPETRCVGRMGYIDGEGFSPYVDGLVFDGEESYKSLFEAVHPCGNLWEWLKEAREIRKGGMAGRLVLAASFASPLISVCNALPFFLHLWGGESGSGKTVALMAASSVWANPDPAGGYIQTFNSTNVGRERLAAVLNHLPVVIDELQLSQNKTDKSSMDVYALAEGIGRTRGNKNGGLDATPSWKNVIITSGETPITAMGAGAGAMNRVIEIEIQPGKKAIEDGPKTAGVLKRHYGFAGKAFIEALYSEETDNREKARRLQQDYFAKLSSLDTTEKQALSASILLAADALATEWIFQDGQNLKVEELSEFLKTKASVSVGVRGYEYICGWVAQNSNKFKKGTENGEVFGVIEPDGGVEYAFINRTVFNKALEDAGFSVSPLLSYLKSEGLLLLREKGFTRGKRINGVMTNCVALKLPVDDETEENEQELL